MTLATNELLEARQPATTLAPLMPEEQAPPVVAVVVSSDPGSWLEESVAALAAQDYTNLSILVIDAGSQVPIAPRVAAVAPQVFLRRLEDNRGYGPSANVVLGAVEGSSHFLFCHDDTVLEPDALRRMVEEAFRSNAGIVCPKLVDYSEPDKILQLGLGVDRFGAPVRRVERGEFDQAQHDEVREVFAAPGACVLIRCDLFATLGGFDEEMSMFGEDVDLCWRARLAGARAIVVPQAVARHLEATSARLRTLPAARDLQWRHELRAVLKNYGVLRRASIVGELAIWSLIEIGYFFAVNRPRRARQVIDAWVWNLASQRHLHRARAAVAASRRLPDREVCSLFSRRTSRVWRFLRPLLEDVATRWSEHARALPAEPARQATRRHRPREVSLAAVALVIVLVFGSRSLLIGHLPLLGQYLPLGSPAQLLGHFFGGYDNAGMSRPGPATPGLAVLGGLGIVVFGAMGLLQKLVLIAAVIAGGIGVARLVRPLGPPAARVGAAVVYLFLPLCWNEVALGNVRALIAFGAAPYLFIRLARATALSPFADPARPTGEPSALFDLQCRREALGFGVLLAFFACFEPLLFVVSLACAFALGLGCWLSGVARAGLRVLIVSLGAALVALMLLFPWSLTFLQAHTSLSVLSGAASDAARALDLSALLRFDLGPLGSGVLGWAFLAAAGFVLIAGHGDRLAWAMRLWTVLLGSAALAWAASQGWLGPGGGSLAVLLSPVAVAIAVLVGLGMATVLDDLRHVHFGLGQLAVIAFCLCCGAGLLPVLGASLGGRWGLADSGYDAVLSWTTPTARQASSQRILWLGDPAALPLTAWQIRPGLALGVSQGGLPGIERVWPDANPGGARALISAIGQAESGTTVRLGHVLAASGIRYLVVPSALAPALSGQVVHAPAPAPPPQVLLDGLAAQSDLHALPEEGGALVLENTAWRPLAHPVLSSPAIAVPAPVRALAVAGEVLLWLVVGRYYLRRRPRRGRRHGRGEHHQELDQALGSLPEQLVQVGARA